MIKMLKLIGINSGATSSTVFFDLSSRDKKKVIKKAIHLANRDQKMLVESVKKRKVSKK